MSRIGKKPLSIPSKVKAFLEGNFLKIEGPNGDLNFTIPDSLQVLIDSQNITVKPLNNNKSTLQKWGMTRTHIQNLLIGVDQGFTKFLDISGVGYRAQVQGSVLKLSLGYSHDVNYQIPEGIVITTPKPTEISIYGINLQRVGQVAAEIISWRPPEPYKGKGINLRGNHIFRKEGKKK